MSRSLSVTAAVPTVLYGTAALGATVNLPTDQPTTQARIDATVTGDPLAVITRKPQGNIGCYGELIKVDRGGIAKQDLSWDYLSTTVAARLYIAGGSVSHLPKRT